MTKPFTWEAHDEAMERDPDFDLFATFGFDHLSDTEIEGIGKEMLRKAEALEAEAKAIKRRHLRSVPGGET